MAIRYWLENMEKKKMVEQYITGYQSKPESLQEIKAMEKLSAEAFGSVKSSMKNPYSKGLKI